MDIEFEIFVYLASVDVLKFSSFNLLFTFDKQPTFQHLIFAVNTRSQPKVYIFIYNGSKLYRFGFHHHHQMGENYNFVLPARAFILKKEYI
jgi:hypothetical protein